MHARPHNGVHIRLTTDAAETDAIQSSNQWTPLPSTGQGVMTWRVVSGQIECPCECKLHKIAVEGLKHPSPIVGASLLVPNLQAYPAYESISPTCTRSAPVLLPASNLG